jgi:hypothetical protein
VWSAFSVLTWAAPPAPTPGNAARTYAEARFDWDGLIGTYPARLPVVLDGGGFRVCFGEA